MHKIKINGILTGNQAHIAEEFNKYFASIGKKLNDDLPPSSIDPLSYLTGDYLNSMNVMQASEFDIISIIKTLPNKKATMDQISVEIIKENAELLAPALKTLFNKSIDTGIFPHAFKHATVIPIYKNGSHAEINNYRPISLLNIFSKIFEKLIKKTLVSFLNTNHIISNCQFRFQSGLSTFDAHNELSTFLYKNLDKGDKVLALFIDFRKAFDTVPHDILLKKLYHYGIRGSILKWFQSYLTGRTQSTRFGEHTSSNTPISVGLPQGSVLGPILFNIYINDLSNISEILKCILFCDDSTLYLKEKNINTLIEKANIELHKLYAWVIANRLTINTDKTVAIVFSTRKILNVPLLFIKNGTSYDVIKRVSTTKFLGVHYDEHLNFKHHISFLSGKLSKLAGMIFSIKDYLPRHILKVIYNAHVNSVLSYNTPIWCCNYKNNIKPIELLQKKIIRNITKSDYLEHTKPLFKQSKILTVVDMNRLYMGSQYKKFPVKYVNPLRRSHQQNTRHYHSLLPIQHSLRLVGNSFRVQGPKNYNSIPLNIRSCRTIYGFKRN